MTKATEHFLPDYHHFGDISTELESRIKIPIKRMPHVAHFNPHKPPFVVFGTSWNHTNAQGPLTEEEFKKDLSDGLDDFARVLNRDHTEMLAYPISHDPPTAWGMAYHSWKGGAYPFDIRAVIHFREDIEIGRDEDDEPILDAGLVFSILTLLGNPEHGS